MQNQPIQQAIAFAEEHGYGFTPMALSKLALITLARRLKENTTYHLLELGGGTSTVFWQGLIQCSNLDLRVTTLEHDAAWVDKLRESITSPNIQLIAQRLKCVDDITYEQIFQNPGSSLNIWSSTGYWIPEQLYNIYTLHNAFYGDLHLIDTAANQYQIVIVDGPHGNGRSLVFPLLANSIAPDALVLLDDFDHYPFLNDLARIFHFRKIHLMVGKKRWILLKLQGRT